MPNDWSFVVVFNVSVYLMFQWAVLPLCLLPNDNQVQVVVASAVTLQAIYMHHIRKEVQFTPGDKQRSAIRIMNTEKVVGVVLKLTPNPLLYLSLISYEASSPLYSMGVWILPRKSSMA